MGLELHITRAAFWCVNDGAEITADEWLQYVASDPELTLSPDKGPCFVDWSGPSSYDEPWLDWFQGNISTKWPDTALYHKMLRIAACLGAKVQDDDGTVYPGEADWTFEPTSHSG